MRLISLPISDLVSFITDSLEDWPSGHKLESGRESETIINAAAAFATHYICTTIPHMASDDADPMGRMLEVLGYPISEMSEEDVEYLCDELDDHFLSMVLIMDMVTGGISKYLKNKEITFSHSSNSEDIVITINDDIGLVRLRKSNAKLKELLPPRHITAKNIDEVELVIAQFVAKTFKASTSEPVRIELKRIFDEAIKRH